MGKQKFLLLFLVLFVIVFIDGKKLTKSRSSSRGTSSSRKTSSPTSLSYPQSSAPKPQPKPSLFGWQEKPAQRTQSRPSNPTNTQTHSYPSSQTGLSGSPVKQPHTNQEVQKSNAPQTHSYPAQQSPSRTVPQQNNQPSYPASGGLSGNSGSSGNYPQSPGLSGNNKAAAPPSYNAANNKQGPPPPYSSANNYPNQHGMTGPGAGVPPAYSGPGGHYPASNYGNTYHQPPPPYHNNYGGYGGHYGGGYNPSYTPQMPGYFGNYGRGFGGPSRTSTALTGVGIAGAGVGTLLTGLALWNLARSTGRHQHTVIYDNRGQPVAVAPANDTEPVANPILGELENCTLTISNDNKTEVLAIPCAIATSFTPDADIKAESNTKNLNDNTKCIVTVTTKAGREFSTTIPCSVLLNTAAENNVTEAPLTITEEENFNGTFIPPEGSKTLNSSETTALKRANGAVSESSDKNNHNITCSFESGEIRDPINPCFAITSNITVIPLETTENNGMLSTPGSA